jgi:hypothetical protein
MILCKVHMVSVSELGTRWTRIWLQKEIMYAFWGSTNLFYSEREDYIDCFETEEWLLFLLVWIQQTTDKLHSLTKRMLPTFSDNNVHWAKLVKYQRQHISVLQLYSW